MPEPEPEPEPDAETVRAAGALGDARVVKETADSLGHVVEEKVGAADALGDADALGTAGVASPSSVPSILPSAGLSVSPRGSPFALPTASPSASQTASPSSVPEPEPEPKPDPEPDAETAEEVAGWLGNESNPEGVGALGTSELIQKSSSVLADEAATVSAKSFSLPQGEGMQVAGDSSASPLPTRAVLNSAVDHMIQAALHARCMTKNVDRTELTRWSGGVNKRTGSTMVSCYIDPRGQTTGLCQVAGGDKPLFVSVSLEMFLSPVGEPHHRGTASISVWGGDTTSSVLTGVPGMQSSGKPKFQQPSVMAIKGSSQRVEGSLQIDGTSLRPVT